MRNTVLSIKGNNGPEKGPERHRLTQRFTHIEKLEMSHQNSDLNDLDEIMPQNNNMYDDNHGFNTSTKTLKFGAANAPVR